jgi:iron complex outermembrane receptor protein
MRHLFLSAASISMMVASSAAAQTRPPSVPDAVPVIEEVVVTAQRKEETLRDVPATISAVTAAQLDALGPVNGVGDLLRTMPGVRFNDLQSNNLSEISIRGSGTQRATGADSGVGLFVNGAYVGSSTLGGRNFRQMDFFDLERVEVLEGPQGALYGRNSEYGVVNIVSAKPKFNDSGYLNAAYTDKLSQTKLTAVVNEQLTDTVAVRLGAQTIGQGKGFYYNPNSRKYYDHTDGWIARGQVRYRKGPLDIDFSVDAQDLNLPTFLNTYVAPPGANAALPLGLTQDRFVIPHDGKDGVHQQAQRAMILADYDLGWGKLTSTSMATHWISRQDYAAAVDFATEANLQKQGQLGLYPFGQTSTVAKDRTFYQDFHLAGEALKGDLDWLAGADYLIQHDLNGTDSTTTPCTFRLGAGICAGTPNTPLCYLPTPTATTCPATFPAAFGTSARAPLRNESKSVYGLVRYHTGGFTLAGELRYSEDKKKAAQETVLLYTSTPASPRAAYVFDSDRLNYTVTASYKIPGPMQSLVYAKIGTGYRAGGVNARTSSPAAPNPFMSTYDNEDTTSYEVGFKGNLARNIYARLSAYRSTTEDAITSITDGCTVLNACLKAGTIFNINGGTVHARGVSAALDGRFHIADGLLSVSVNGARQQAHYVKTPANYSGLPVVGSSVAQIPKWTASTTVDYRHRITEDVTAFGNISYQGQSGGVQDTVTVATPAIYLKDVDLMSLRAGVDIKRIQVALFVQNLTNKQIALLQFTSNNAPLANRYNAPRTIGANIIYRW